MLNLCLFHPEIPQNTGNIARTCAVTGSRLHLIRPLGFDISEKAVRHAGLDYWDKLSISVHDSLDELLQEASDAYVYFFSKRGQHLFSEIEYKDDKDTFLIFGPESTGFDDEMIEREHDRVLRIPMKSGVRSLNLSNSVAIAAYEYYRQLGYPGFETIWGGDGV